MAFLSDYFRNWLAGRVATQAITMGLHTDDPGSNGTANRATNNSGARGVTKTVAAGDITADGASVDNDNDVEFFTPDSTRAGQAITHLSYWFGSNFIGSVQLAAPVTTVESVPFIIAAGAARITFSLKST